MTGGRSVPLPILRSNGQCIATQVSRCLSDEGWIAAVDDAAGAGVSAAEHNSLD